MYYAKFLGTGLRNRGALPRFFSIHEAITKKISVHTFFIKKILYTFGGNQRICKPARPQMTGLPTMAGWSWAAPNGPEDFPAQKYPRRWVGSSLLASTTSRSIIWASLSPVTLCLFPVPSPAPSPVVTSPPGEMGFVGDTLESIRSMQVRHVLSQIINLGR